MIHVPGIERLQDFLHAVSNIAPAAQRVAADAADAGIVNDHGANFVQLRAMRRGVLPGAEQALLFAAEEHETDRAARHAGRWL